MTALINDNHSGSITTNTGKANKLGNSIRYRRGGIKMNLLGLKKNLASLISRGLIKYLIAGFISFIADFIVFRTLYITLGFNLQFSTLAGLLSGFIIGFIMQKFWSFRGNHAKNTNIQIAIFIGLLIVNTLFTSFVVSIAESSNINHGAEFGKLVATFFVVSWNYLTFKLIVFKPKTKTPTLL